MIPEIREVLCKWVFSPRIASFLPTYRLKHIMYRGWVLKGSRARDVGCFFWLHKRENRMEQLVCWRLHWNKTAAKYRNLCLFFRYYVCINVCIYNIQTHDYLYICFVSCKKALQKFCAAMQVNRLAPANVNLYVKSGTRSGSTNRIYESRWKFGFNRRPFSQLLIHTNWQKV